MGATTINVSELQARREALRADRDNMERRAVTAFRLGRLDDSQRYADEAARIGEQLDAANAELIAAGH